MREQLFCFCKQFTFLIIHTYHLKGEKIHAGNMCHSLDQLSQSKTGRLDRIWSHKPVLVSTRRTILSVPHKCAYGLVWSPCVHRRRSIRWATILIMGFPVFSPRARSPSGPLIRCHLASEGNPHQVEVGKGTMSRRHPRSVGGWVAVLWRGPWGIERRQTHKHGGPKRNFT